MNKLLYSSKLFLKRNGSTILTGMGAVGLVATTVTAVKATPKALALLEKAKEEKGEELTKVEAIRIGGPVYIPSFVMGVATISCIFGANFLNKRSQASLLSAYALIDNSYKEYQNKVQEMYGEEANDKVKEEIAKDKYEDYEVIFDDGKELFFDSFSGRYFESTMKDVFYAEYEVNRSLSVEYSVTLGKFYDLLGLPNDDPSYDALGWACGSIEEMYWHPWIEFNHNKIEMDDGLECTIIEMPLPPFIDYNNW